MEFNGSTISVLFIIEKLSMIQNETKGAKKKKKKIVKPHEKKYKKKKNLFNPKLN
jgi:hypothetical protein